MRTIQAGFEEPKAVAGNVARWPKLKLDARQKKLWDETRAAMLWAVPSFSDIWYALMVDKDGETAWWTDQVPTGATDDKFLYLNPKWYFALTLEERLFVNSHEIAHAMFGHMGMFHLLLKQGAIRYSDGKELKVDGELLNCAADYVINDMLVKSKIGAMPEGGLHDPTLITGDMSVLDAYRVLYQAAQQQPPGPCPVGPPGGGGGGKGSKPGQKPGRKPGKGKGPPDEKQKEAVKKTTKGGQTAPGGQPFDEHLRPGEGRGKTPGEACAERNEALWDNTIHAALESARLRGELPAGLERAFGRKLKPKANWKDLFQLAVARRIGNERYSWEQADPELMYRRIGFPARVNTCCELVVIAVDTSGSINQSTMDIFMAEAQGVFEQYRPKRVIVCQCDAAVHEWTEIADMEELYGRKLLGGGGTDFVPVFDRVTKEDEHPDLLVYLTDMYGSFPPVPPPYPVVWGSVSKGVPAPFGEIVEVPLQCAEEE